VSEFLKYQHIERLGSDEVDGILEGRCYVFPKIDGTNASVWMEDDGLLHAGSRNRELSTGNDNAGFCQWVEDNTREFMPLLDAHPWYRIYGEWLVPHTLRTYREDAWRKFYIFDVYDQETEAYLPYERYADICAGYLLPFPVIAPIEIVENATLEHLHKVLDRNTYLIADGNGSGEGIVIKRYDYVNRYGRATWAKIVRNEFKERNLEAFGTPTVAMNTRLEQAIAIEYVTRGRVSKAMDKMRDVGPVTSRRIPELLGRIWNDVVTEEMWGIVKTRKNPTINFKALNRAVIAQTKVNCPELFG